MKSTQYLAAAVTALGLVSQGFAQNNNNGNNNGNVNAQGGNNGNNNNGNNGNNNNNNGNNNNGNNGNNGNGGGGGAAGLTLLQANVQAGSNSQGTPDIAAGQSNSKTDPFNFINFCTGKTITNGKQVTQGSCNGIVMGDIPSNNNMVSAIVVFPGPGEDIGAANTDFDVKVQLTNLVAGSFTDPINTYYSAPQELQGGNIVGHCHVTVQDMNNNIAPTQPLDPKKFAFFKGINDDGNGAGLLSATVVGGLPAGTYRVCTMNSASNHQPVLMPVSTSARSRIFSANYC